ncbi:MAG: L-threonylcarbamoyladenylate synthase [Candidatus Omnitrophota bacterium]|nr:L-threonylcarbamoyladenylate synthase [Candidatus Omnitrophota bacterium]
MKTTIRLKIDSRDPDLSKIRDVARACREGQLVGFPTETVYGIGGPMSVADTADKLRQLKRRDGNRPFSYHIGDWEMIEFLGVQKTPVFRYLARQFWPGPVTLLALGKNDEKIGLRFPSNHLALALLNSVGEPFIATSANISGEISGRTCDDVMEAFEGQIGYVIDGGRTEHAEDSTIVDVTTGAVPEIVRRGASIKKVEAAIENICSGKYPRKHILIVCTGNSCRSPMAEGWLRDKLEQAGLEEEIEVSSCGIGARMGASATPEAVLTMKNRDMDISEHRSKPCTRFDVLDADMVIAMGPQHATFISSILRGTKEKLKVLNIMDPIGMSITVYEEVFLAIEHKMNDLWDEIIG